MLERVQREETDQTVWALALEAQLACETLDYDGASATHRELWLCLLGTFRA